MFFLEKINGLDNYTDKLWLLCQSALLLCILKASFLHLMCPLGWYKHLVYDKLLENDTFVKK